MNTNRNAEHDAIRGLMKEHGIERVLLGATDIDGQFRAKFIPAWRFAEEPSAPLHFADVLAVMDLAGDIIPPPPDHDGWWPSWDSGFDDLEVVPDLRSFRPAPWIPAGAICLGDFHDLDGVPLQAMPRNVLKRVTDRAAGLGLSAKMAPEYEFFLFEEPTDQTAPVDYRRLKPLGTGATAYGGERVDADLKVVSRIQEGIEGLGVPIEATNAEAGPGQYELNLTPQDAVLAGDQATLFKYAAKRIAAESGYIASFMPKLGAGGFGSSLHVHQSLWRDGQNIFFDAADPEGISQVFRHYIGGAMRTLREFTALFAPTITSYKRFEPEAAAGTNVAWAFGSKTVSLRAVRGSQSATRLEHRTPGADANPYLVLAAMLAGGLWGIEHEIDPGPPVKGNAYRDPSLELVPGTLAEAIELFDQSDIAREVFGDQTVDYYVATRRWEVEQFNAAVTDWEFQRYFRSI